MNVFEHSTSRIQRNLFRATAGQIGFPTAPPFPLHLTFHRYFLGPLLLTRLWQEPPREENHFLWLSFAGADPSLKGQALLLEIHTLPVLVPLSEGSQRCPACLSGNTQVMPKTLFVKRPVLTLRSKSTPVVQDVLLNKDHCVEAPPSTLWYCTCCGYKFSPPEIVT
jgi:hypothetical protein